MVHLVFADFFSNALCLASRYSHKQHSSYWSFTLCILTVWTAAAGSPTAETEFFLGTIHNNNNNLRLMWLRQTAQPYMWDIQQTTVCHAGQQWHTLSCRTATTRFSPDSRLPETNSAKWAVTCKHSPDGATKARWNSSDKQLCYSFIDTERMKGWVGLANHLQQIHWL